GTDPNPNFPRTYRINFRTPDGSRPLALDLNGTYTLNLAADIRSSAGDPMDTNLNAGVDQLRNTPSAGTQQVTRASTNVPLPVGNLQTTTSFLDVNDDFVVTGLTLQLNILYGFDPDLRVTLIAPNMTEIRLFDKVGDNPISRSDFRDT